MQGPILIVDALNAFIRSFAAYTTYDVNGQPIGGCVGFLKTLRKLSNDICPSAIYVVWESGGSPRRRAIFPEYKQNRRPEKLNRFYDDDIPESDENKHHQIVSLIKILRNVPLYQVYVAECEGDDVIAYLCKKFAGNDIVIASSDKDMYQLLDEKVKIFSFHKKIFVTADDVTNEYRISPQNFAIAKSICGDTSDNVPGVKGVGFKTIQKKLPILMSSESLILDDVINYCASHRSESNLYEKILSEADIVKRNWKLVYLGSSSISASQATKIDAIVEGCRPTSNKVKFIRALHDIGVEDFDVNGFFYSFNCISKE